MAVKSHYAELSRQKFSRVIVIIRNPVDTILAFFNLENAGHVGTASVSAYNTSEYYFALHELAYAKKCDVYDFKSDTFNMKTVNISSIHRGGSYEYPRSSV